MTDTITTKTNPQTTLQSAKSLTGCQLKAIDGQFGKCRDILFDDEKWVIRYLVADTGRWLPGRKVVISPYALADPDLGSSRSEIPVKLTKKQIEDCPPLQEHAPISRRYEQEIARYFGHPLYWDGTGYWGPYLHPTQVAPISPQEQKDLQENKREIEETHLRSAEEVMKYRIKASDGEIGHVVDFIAESTSWLIRYLVVSTRNWLPGRNVLIAPTWIGQVKYEEASVDVHMTREAIKGSPEYVPHQPINRDYEGKLYDYYGVQRYW